MFYSLRGKIVEIFENHLILEVNDFSFLIYVIRTDVFYINQTIKLLIVNLFINERESVLIGFLNNDCKEAFLKLINIKNVGPKTALKILKNISVSDLYLAIRMEDTNFLVKNTGINEKIALQIIIELKNKVLKDNKSCLNKLTNIRTGLKNMGFKLNEIDPILIQIASKNKSNEEIFKEALRRLNSNE